MGEYLPAPFDPEDLMMKKRRSEAFFGMHFDFHAGQNQENIGENCNPAAIEAMLEQVKPDYVQCDTKGHAGASSYPTRVGNPAPNMKGDILRMWREVTERHDVALFAHHSGIWDNLALRHHPEWAAVGPDGTPDKDKASVFGPYADELLIPQLLEMALDYGLDGAWVDGECWAAVVDYSHWAAEKYRARYHEEPPLPDEENYPAYQNFCREGFRSYVDYYVRQVHKAAPDFQLTSNWIFTSYLPEPPIIGVDYLSGDYAPNDSLNSARFEGRCLAAQGKPWDLMAWGFSSHGGMHCVKSAPQLCQEAAAVIMLGGGFQFYNRQMVGSIQSWAVPVWKQLAEFCRARQALCHRAEAVPQVGIIFSERAHYHKLAPQFSNGSHHASQLRGTLSALLDCGYSVEVLMTHHALTRDLSAYGALVVPDLEVIESSLRSALLEYARQGGKLILAGHNTAQLFLPYLDIDVIGGGEEGAVLYPEADGLIAPLRTPYRHILLQGDSRMLGQGYTDESGEGDPLPLASAAVYGSGEIAGIYFNTGNYAQSQSPVLRNFLGSVMKQLFTPAVRLPGRENAEISLMRQGDLLCVNLLNRGGSHADPACFAFDSLPPLRDIALEIDYPGAPAEVRLEPEGIALPFTWEDGVIHTTVDKLDIHSVVTVR